MQLEGIFGHNVNFTNAYENTKLIIVKHLKNNKGYFSNLYFSFLHLNQIYARMDMNCQLFASSLKL